MRLTSKLASDAMEVGYLIRSLSKADTTAVVDLARGAASKAACSVDMASVLDYKTRAISSIVSRVRRHGDISEAQQAFILLVDEDVPALYAAKLVLMDDAPEPEVWAFEIVNPETVVWAFKAGIHMSTIEGGHAERVTRAGISCTTEEMVYYARLRVIERIIDLVRSGADIPDRYVAFCRMLGYGDLNFKYSCCSLI